MSNIPAYLIYKIRRIYTKIGTISNKIESFKNLRLQILDNTRSILQKSPSEGNMNVNKMVTQWSNVQNKTEILFWKAIKKHIFILKLSYISFRKDIEFNSDVQKYCRKHEIIEYKLNEVVFKLKKYICNIDNAQLRHQYIFTNLQSIHGLDRVVQNYEAADSVVKNVQEIAKTLQEHLKSLKKEFRKN